MVSFSAASSDSSQEQAALQKASGPLFQASLLLKIFISTLAIIFFLAVYAWIFMKSIEKISLLKQRSVKDLVEGDWIVKNIFVKGKRIAGPKDLGISKKQIELLKKYKIKKVLVKEGVPFVPSFLLGYIATLALGNWIRFFV